MTKLIFGCGYLGERVAQRWCEAGHDVAVVTRSRHRAEAFEGQGFQAIVADITRPESLTSLPAAESVLFAVGYDRSSGPPITEVYAGGVRNVLAALPADTGRFIYISTTGVYGNADGDWVDEQTPPDPQREGGRASLAAEQALAVHLLGTHGVILRLAGIYGPGRVPFLDQLHSGEPIPTLGEGYLNLIHVDDAVAAVLAAEEATVNDGPLVYCISDGRPVERGQFYAEAARQIGAAAPQFVAPDPASPRVARATANRRVRNDLMLAQLRVRLNYPDCRAGLAAILNDARQNSGPANA